MRRGRPIGLLAAGSYGWLSILYACGMNNEGMKKAAPVLTGAALLKLMPETYLAAGAAAGAAAAVAGRFSQKIQ